jgi:polysaccharide export outer membrane protein
MHRLVVAVRFRTAFMMACVIGALAVLTAQDSAYRVGVRDVLRVSVWSQADLSGQFTVGASGGITFPLVGDVRATGLTVDQIEEELRKRLADGYLRNPQVSVEVAEYHSQRVFVVGEVRTPGVVPLTGALTLVEALTRVGSLTDASGGELVVIRPPSGRPVSGPVLPNEPGAREVLRVDVKTLQSRGPTSNVTLQDGDTIVVPRAELVYAVGQVNSPGAYPHERGMTVMQVISRAGGVNDLGATTRLKIIRIVDGAKKEIKATLADKVQIGDTIVVPTRFF